MGSNLDTNWPVSFRDGIAPIIGAIALISSVALIKSCNYRIYTNEFCKKTNEILDSWEELKDLPKKDSEYYKNNCLDVF